MKRPQLRIKSQLILGIALIHTALMTLFVVDLVHKQRAFLLEESLDTATALSETLAANATSWTLARDFVGLEEVIASQAHFPGLEFAMVIDNRGRVLGYSDGDMVGRYVDDPVSRQLLEQPPEDNLEDNVVLVNDRRWIDVASRIHANDHSVGWARVRLDREPLNAALSALTREGILYALAAILLGVLVAWWMGNGLTTRLQHLITATRAVRAGQRHLKLSDTRQDELGELTQHFDTMVTALDNRERELHEARERVQITLESMGEGMITVDADGRVTYLNPVAEEQTGWTASEAEGLPVEEVYPTLTEDGLAPRENPVANCLARGERDSGENLVLRERCGGMHAVEDTVAPMYARDGSLGGAVIIFRDASDARDLQRRLSWQASHDSLTELFNRSAFEARLEDMVRRRKRHDGEDALLFLDLDQFKLVNDSMGHQAGDALLRQVADSIDAVLRDDDFFARLGGDEFAILLPDTGLPAAEAVAEKITAALHDLPFTWQGNTFTVTGSIGLAGITPRSTPTGTLSRADVAMYVAKDKGRNRWHVYNADGENGEPESPDLDWVGEVRQALRESRFELHLQPIVGLKSPEQPRLAEILVRMRRGNGELVSPARFIPAAERYGLIDEMDLSVLRRAIEWIEAVDPPYERIDVNLSGQSLESAHFMEEVVATLEAHPRLGHRLCFEITETAAIRHLQPATDFLHQVKRFGCQLSLDDFGSGFASFQQLKRLPVDFVKIDGAFVRDILRDPVDAAMVRAIHGVSRTMDIRTVAEFVENADIATELKRIGIDYAQGYHYSAPFPVFVDGQAVVPPDPRIAPRGQAAGG